MSAVTGSMPRLRRSRPKRPNDGSARSWRIVVVFGLLALVVWGLLSVSVVPLALEVREGEVSQTNVRSPRKLTYTSPVLTKREREKASAAVQEVVEIDPGAVQKQRAGLTALLQGISAVRTSPGLSPDQRKSQLARLGQPPLEEPSITWLAGLDDSRWYLVSSEAQRLLWAALQDKLPEWRVPEVVRELPLRVSDQLSANERSLSVDLASRFVGGNIVPNREATNRLRKEAEDAVAPVQVTVEKGETVLSEGQVVSAADIEKLDLLGLRNPTTDWRQVGAAAAFAVLTMSMLAAYIGAFQSSLVNRERGLGLIALLVIVTVLAAKVVLPTRPLLLYAFPLPAVAMLVATLIDGRLAIVVGALLGVLLGFVTGNSFEAATLALATSVVAAGAVWRRERLTVFFVAGLLVALAQMAVVVAFQLAQRGEDVQTLLMIAAFCIVNGLVAAMLAVGATYVLGRIFGITTTMQLLELANPTQPLLRRLLMEAPGTYHHSIMVGNLGERAAEEVGADPLLVRVGAYYHDIGKLRRPYFFVENQAGGENVHETLEPEVSADIVRAHVRDGVELCEQYGVPPAVRSLIPQHHGTRLVSFFYDQAVDAAAATGQQQPDPVRFKYPGPRPQTKEGAILMLADSVEAAARASRDHSAEAITALVEKLVMGRVAEGQLDDCDLTLRDVQRIKDAFRAILIGMYHPRIEYPERPPIQITAPAPASAPLRLRRSMSPTRGAPTPTPPPCAGEGLSPSPAHGGGVGVGAPSSPLDLDLRFHVRRRSGARPNRAALRAVCAAAIAGEGVTGPVVLTLTLVDDDEIHQINRQHRAVDRPTDVLSFPLVDGTDSFALPPGALVQLGDVVVSYPRAVAQAEEYGHHVERELAYLVVHGVLHILGHDHEVPEEQSVMRAREEAALALVGLIRTP